MNIQDLEIAKKIFKEYADCEKLVEMDGHIISKQPALSKNSFNHLINHVYSLYKKKESDLLECLITVHSQLIDGGQFKEDSALMLSIQNAIKKATE